MWIALHFLSLTGLKVGNWYLSVRIINNMMCRPASRVVGDDAARGGWEVGVGGGMSPQTNTYHHIRP